MRWAYIIYDEPICEPSEFQQGLLADCEDIKDTERRQWESIEVVANRSIPQVSEIRKNLPIF